MEMALHFKMVNWAGFPTAALNASYQASKLYVYIHYKFDE